MVLNVKSKRNIADASIPYMHICACNNKLMENHNYMLLERIDLPREEDNIMSGYFGFVAIWVTHPLCPRRVPLS